MSDGIINDDKPFYDDDAFDDAPEMSSSEFNALLKSIENISEKVRIYWDGLKLAAKHICRCGFVYNKSNRAILAKGRIFWACSSCRNILSCEV